MPLPEIIVRSVRGRYPRRARLRSENIVATSVREVARVYRIRLDDSSHRDFWLELTVEVDAQALPSAVPRPAA
jgi:hypothetical protein